MELSLEGLDNMTGIFIHMDSRGAKEIIGLQVTLPIGSDPSLVEQIQNNPLANELGKLLCLAMGNPAGCIPLRVTLMGQEP
jgi:hypothetical protein